jgi:hypothetical protein
VFRLVLHVTDALLIFLEILAMGYRLAGVGVSFPTDFFES